MHVACVVGSLICLLYLFVVGGVISVFRYGLLMRCWQVVVCFAGAGLGLIWCFSWLL